MEIESCDKCGELIRVILKGEEIKRIMTKYDPDLIDWSEICKCGGYRHLIFQPHKNRLLRLSFQLSALRAVEVSPGFTSLNIRS